jgi:hypothetical protein
MKEYLLNSAKAFSFFKENLSQLNELSNGILEILQIKPGTFHAFLPENMSAEKVHDFSSGGKTSSLRNEISFKLADIINSDASLSCVFDDFNSGVDSVNNNDLYQSYGACYQREIYYQIYFGSNQELVLKCLNYSSTIWHSLCVVFKDDLNYKKEKKEISESYIKMICKNAMFVMIEAYDSESYIYWCDSEAAIVLKNI